MRKELIKTSKFLSLVLRHDPDLIGVTMDPQGWVDVEELLAKAGAKGRRITRDEILEILDTCDKKRLVLSEDGKRIKAHQGHSIQIEHELEATAPPDFLYHGTATRHLDSIKAQGLLKMKRHHVHLSADEETAVKVGQRHGKPVVLKIATAPMVEAGFDFYVSGNGVWLCDHIPVEFIDFPA